MSQGWGEAEDERDGHAASPGRPMTLPPCPMAQNQALIFSPALLPRAPYSPQAHLAPPLSPSSARTTDNTTLTAILKLKYMYTDEDGRPPGVRRGLWKRRASEVAERLGLRAPDAATMAGGGTAREEYGSMLDGVESLRIGGE